LRGGENREKGWLGMAIIFVGTISRKDRLGNGPSIERETYVLSVFLIEPPIGVLEMSFITVLEM
jgi:hypothetical protein